jgi:putative transposase
MMTAIDLPVLLAVYADIAPGELFVRLQKNLGLLKRAGIYTARIVIWMMIRQRLDGHGSLASAVNDLLLGRMDALLSRCKRVMEKRVGTSTGGYCRARQKLPMALMERTVDEILLRLRTRIGNHTAVSSTGTYVLDGSSLQLEHCEELKAAFPPAPNQRGESHWPVLRIVVLHDVETALAQKMCRGPMFGPAAVSEQALAVRAVDALPPGAFLIADRNFGIFSVGWAATVRGHKVIVRLTKERAQKLAGQPISVEGERLVVWKPSRWDKCLEGQWPEGAEIAGRLIACRVGSGRHKEWLYLFTTFDLPLSEVVKLYGKRWNVETDLRSLKRTARLHRLAVKSVAMMDKELLAATLAYNLVRAIMTMAACKAGIAPRRLSFARAYDLIDKSIAEVLAAPTTTEQINRMERVVDLIARSKLPLRPKHRSFPRSVWGTGKTYPSKYKSK